MDSYGPSSRHVLEDGYEAEVIEPESSSDHDWVERARRAWERSDDWFDSAVRNQVESAIRAFNSQHGSGSKYHSPAYEKRTKLFRPRTRGNIRKLEAAMAVALFSTTDVVSVDPYDEGDAEANRLAEIKQLLVRRRLSEPKFGWFSSIMGSFQSACKERVAIGHVGWDYETDSLGQVIKDQPFFDPVPLELFRIDPAADWRDPVNTSPYVIHEKPMYVGDLLRGMESQNGEPPRFRKLTKDQLLTGSESDYDSIRNTREGHREDRYNERQGPREYQTVWVKHCIMHKDGHDWVYDTVGDTYLLTTPKRIEEVYHHCKTKDRPYVMGSAVLEAFKPYPGSPAELGLPVQEEINEISNLTMDMLKHNTTKRHFVRRGSALDLQTMLRSVPGSVIFTNDPANDIKEETSRSIPNGVFAERDRLTSEMDDLLGTFMGSSVGVQRRLNETVGGMNLIADNQNQVQEFTLRTFVELFAEPVLNKIMRAIEIYESDERLMMAVAKEKKAELVDVYDALLVEAETKVQVGFGNINPQKRMERIIMAADATGRIMPDVLMQADRREMIAEIWGAAGYRDGARFFPSVMKSDVDPMVQQLQQQNEELQRQIDLDRAKGEVQIQIEQIRQEGRLRLEQMRHQQVMGREEAKQAFQYYQESNKMRLAEFDRLIEQAESERETQRLRHEREALSHSISMAEREFAMRLQEMVLRPQMPTQAPALPAPRDEFQSVPNQARQLIASLRKPSSGSPVELGEPMNLPGQDSAGILARGDYGKIPFQAG